MVPVHTGTPVQWNASVKDGRRRRRHWRGSLSLQGSGYSFLAAYIWARRHRFWIWPPQLGRWGTWCELNLVTLNFITSKKHFITTKNITYLM